MLEKILKAVEGSIAIEKRTLPSEKIECANLQILLPEKKVYRNGKEILLNRHEFDTLVYLAKHPGWVRSKEQIYEAVWTEEVIMKIQSCGVSASFGRNWSRIRTDCSTSIL